MQRPEDRMWWLLGLAHAADAIVALEVTGPDGAIVLAEELVLPSERTLSAPDGTHLLRISTAAVDATRATVELGAGKPRDGQPKVKVARSFELTPYEEQAETLAYKGSAWTVKATLGSAWAATEPSAEPVDPYRYVLVWDDAGLLESPRKPTSAVKERELPGGRTDPAEQASPMLYVDAWGTTHLELETIPTPGAAHCQAGGPPLKPWALQHYVAVSDVVPTVTAREIATRRPDGTGYRVAAGVPLTAEEGKYRVVTGGLSFLVEATADDVASSYHPSVHFPAGEGPMSLAPGIIGSTALGEVRWTGAEPLPVAGLQGLKAPIATVRVPCAEVRLHPADGAWVR